MATFARLTIDDIARLAGVSRTTASLVLNGRAETYRISKTTQERVLAVAAEHQFQPSQSARALRARASHTLGLVVPQLTNFTHASLAEALEPLAREAGYQLMIVSSSDDPVQEAAGIGQLIARQVDGLIVVPCNADPAVYAGWARRLPLVFADRRVPGSSVPFVVTAAAAATEALVGGAIADGAREILYIGGGASLSTSADRLAGYRAAVDRAGIAVGDDWISERDYLRTSGQARLADWVNRHGRYPQAVFTGGITLLEGVLAFVNAHGGTGPDFLLTFDDHPLLDCLPQAVQSVAQDSHTLAADSLAAVLALLAGQPAEPERWIDASVRRRQR
ncbi:LacI family DNA-binding transcriptional regulator [Jeongeupia sp. USM3]|uniref:LacI family DNA-binding transcriptional regulator n=1 Tax=Jeongeupia sp. USM3 TaxID=1906741 RepID=UPI00089E0766|nr:LacI family DNA-binding transcriptional regulator [Jeongeupia sp. USM3]AOY00218.1 transcriptional regulator [Jeongeupia sp. USM3]